MKSRNSIALAVCVLAIAAGCRRPNAAQHVERGKAAYDAKRYPEAILEFRAALQADARRAEAHERLADTYVKTGELGKALSEYVRAADLSPNRAELQVKAGSFLLLAGQF